MTDTSKLILVVWMAITGAAAVATVVAAEWSRRHSK